MKVAFIALALVGFSLQAHASLPDPAVCGNNSYAISFKVARTTVGKVSRDNVETTITDIMGNTVGIFRQTVRAGSLESNLIKSLSMNAIEGGKSKLTIKASNSDIDQLIITGIGPNVETMFCNLLN